MNVLDLRLPDGNLCRRVAATLERAGYRLPDYGPGQRIYHPAINVEQVSARVRRPMQIAIELAKAEADVGVTGFDCICEFPGAKLILDLRRPVTRLALAVPKRPELDQIRVRS